MRSWVQLAKQLQIPGIIVVGIFLAACGTDPLALSDSEAKKRIAQIFGGSMEFVPLGHLSAVRDAIGGRQLDRGKGEISLAEFKNLRTWEQVGIVKIADVQDLSNGFTGWNNWFALTQSGTQIRFLASEGPKAGEFHCTDSVRTWVRKYWGETTVLCVPQGEKTMGKIVQNERHDVGADHYRVVTGTYVYNASPIYSEYLKTAGKRKTMDVRFIVALKYDPFSSIWNMATVDTAEGDAEFRTQNVRSLLVAK